MSVVGLSKTTGTYETLVPIYQTTRCHAKKQDRTILAIRALDFKIGLQLRDDTKSVPEEEDCHVSLLFRNQLLSQIILTSCTEHSKS